MAKMRCVTSLLLFVLFSLSGCSTHQPPFKQGEWLFTSQGESQGKFMTPATLTYHHCLRYNAPYPVIQQNSQGCKTQEQMLENIVTWTTICQNNGVETRIEGESIFAGDTMNGTVLIIKNGEATKNSVLGKWHGVCP